MKLFGKSECDRPDKAKVERVWAELRAQYDADLERERREHPDGAAYRIWQGPDGWFYVGSGYREETSFYRDRFSAFGNIDTYVPDADSRILYTKAFSRWLYRAFDPKHRTQEEAEAWLKEYVTPPPVKEAFYDADGNAVPP